MKPKIVALFLLLCVPTIFMYNEYGNDEEFEFDDYELENVDNINQQLLIPFEFQKPGVWSSTKDRYLFYASALDRMKHPINRPSFLDQNATVILDRTNVSDEIITQGSRWLNLAWYIQMSKSSSDTLRKIALQAEHSLKTKGTYLVAAGATSATAGILGILGLLLAPFTGGVSLFGLLIGGTVSGSTSAVLTASSLGASAVAIGTASAANRLPTEADYSKMATNHLQMVYEQGNFVTEFLDKATDVFDETLYIMTEDEYDDVAKTLLAGDALTMLSLSDPDMAEPLTMTQQSLQAIISSHRLRDIRNAHTILTRALTPSATENSKMKAMKKLKDLFKGKMNDFIGSNSKLKKQGPHLNHSPKSPTKSHSILASDKWAKEFAKFERLRRDLKPWGAAKWQTVKNLLPKSIMDNGKWTQTIINHVKKGVAGVTILSSLVSVAMGIYDIIIGAQKLSGSGSIVHHIREQANNLDSIQINVLSIYQSLTGTPVSELDLGLVGSDIMTGIQLFACNHYDSGTSDDIYVNIRNTNESMGTCNTNSLVGTSGINVDRGYWHDYGGIALGSCNSHPLDETFQLELTAMGTDAMCLQHVTVSTDFQKAPRYNCPLPKKDVWLGSSYKTDYDYGYPDTDYNSRLKSKCEHIPGISQVTILTGKSSSGSNTMLKVDFSFDSGKTCRTNYLDNPRDNDFQPGSSNIFLADTLGECFNTKFKQEDMIYNQTTDEFFIRAKLRNEIYPIEIAGMDFYVNFNHHSERFVCDIGPKGLLLQRESSQELLCFLKKRTFNTRALDAIEVVPAETPSQDSLRFEICTGEDQVCCETTPIFDFRQNVPQKLQGLWLGRCEDFIIMNDTYTITPIDSIGNRPRNHGLKLSSIYGTRFPDVAPLHTCEYFGTPCKIPNQFQVSKINFGVCQDSYSGTDGSISVQMKSNGRSCDTGVFDKYGNDFVRGSWSSYRAHELGTCANFPIATNDLQVIVTNAGSDGLCLDKLQIDGTGTTRPRLFCYVDEDGVWIDNDKVIFKCTYSEPVKEKP